MTDIDVTHIGDSAGKSDHRPTRKLRKQHRTPAGPTMSDQASKLLKRPRGATIAELCTATGWQPHSVRALLSGLRKKGVSLVRETRKTGEGSYRIADAYVEAASPSASTAAVIEAA